MDRDGLLFIGRVIKAHGLRGAVEVQPFSGDPGEFRRYRELLLVLPATGLLPAEDMRPVRQARVKGRVAILEFAGVEDRTGAERLAGAEVWVAKAALPAPGTGEFYWHEVIGMMVLTREGRDLGRVQTLFSTRAHDVLVVAGGRRELLIPAVNAFIDRIDYENRTLVVDPPPGLLEMND